MKTGILFIAILALALLIMPMVAINLYDGQAEESAGVHAPAHPVPSSAPDAPEASRPAESPVAEEAPGEAEEADAFTEIDEDTGAVSTRPSVRSFLILDEATGVVSEVALRDYVRGAVAAEMPVSFHPEALKAQAVAAHTFALHNHYVQQESPDPALKGADFSADPSGMKVYITEATAREFYGETYADVYWDKICQAADSVLPYIMEYDEEPIVAAYHAISAGETEAASNVWSGSADYLLPAVSEGDLLAPGYESEATFSVEAVRSALLAAWPGMDLSGSPDTWFDSQERSDSGYVTNLHIGGVDVHGKEIRTLFDLRSHNFDILYSEQGFTFIVYGYGHGVGLSQYGADFLARQGWTFDEILENYYTGVELREIWFEDGE